MDVCGPTWKEGVGGWGVAKLNKPRRGEIKGNILAVGEACMAIKSF